MNRMMLVVGVCLWGVLPAVAGAQTGTLRMRFVYDGTPPPPKRIDVGAKSSPRADSLIDERLLVDPTSRGIKNVLVYLYTGRGEARVAVPPHQPQKRRVAMADGRFDPHLLIARAGDTLEFVEAGRELHNPNVSFFNNLPQGIVVPPGKPRTMPVPKPEPAPLPVVCNIHPWMRCYVAVLDHPFAAISDTDGNLVIEDLPVGTRLTFRVFHEAGRIDRVNQSGTPTDWTKSRFSVQLVAGVNDLGEIRVPPELFVD